MLRHHWNVRVAASIALLVALAACRAETPPAPPQMEMQLRLDARAVDAVLIEALAADGVTATGAEADVIVSGVNGGGTEFNGAKVTWNQSGVRVETRLTRQQAATRIQERLVARGVLPEEAQVVTGFSNGGLTLRWRVGIELTSP